MFCISEQIHIVLVCNLVDGRSNLRRKSFVTDCLSCGAVDDFSAIKRENIASVVAKAEFFGKRNNTGSRSAGGENYLFSVLLNLDKSLPCGRGNFLFGVGQCSVQIQYKYIIGHGFALSVFRVLFKRKLLKACHNFRKFHSV